MQRVQTTWVISSEDRREIAGEDLHHRKKSKRAIFNFILSQSVQVSDEQKDKAFCSPGLLRMDVLSSQDGFMACSPRESGQDHLASFPIELRLSHAWRPWQIRVGSLHISVDGLVASSGLV
jgi:hypothetical protein